MNTFGHKAVDSKTPSTRLITQKPLAHRIAVMSATLSSTMKHDGRQLPFTSWTRVCRASKNAANSDWPSRLATSQATGTP
jgi:hypothetical protein